MLLWHFLPYIRLHINLSWPGKKYLGHFCLFTVFVCFVLGHSISNVCFRLISYVWYGWLDVAIPVEGGALVKNNNNNNNKKETYKNKTKIWNRTRPRALVQNQQTREVIIAPEWRHTNPTTKTWVAYDNSPSPSKYKVHKRHQRYIKSSSNNNKTRSLGVIVWSFCSWYFLGYAYGVHLHLHSSTFPNRDHIDIGNGAHCNSMPTSACTLLPVTE